MSEPLALGETLTSVRCRELLTAAAGALVSGECSTVASGFAVSVSLWLERLSGEIAPAGTPFSHEMLGGLALADVVLRSRRTVPLSPVAEVMTRPPKPPADVSWIKMTMPTSLAEICPRDPWWRRLLRRPPRFEYYGRVVGQTPPGGSTDVPESGE